MIRSTESLMAEDVTIRCTVRRSSQFAKLLVNKSNNINGSLTSTNDNERQEMTCTMRNWDTYKNSQRKTSFTKVYHKLAQTALHGVTTGTNYHDSHTSEPELLLTPIHQFLSDRDDSPVRTRSIRVAKQASVTPLSSSTTTLPLPFTIPVSDIMLAYTFGIKKSTSLSCNNHKINIATLSSGMFEFEQLTDNAHDILLAFLQGALPPERIVDSLAIRGSHRDYPDEIQSKSSVSSCLDIDALHARHVDGRNETWPEKFSRRVGHVVNSLSELCDVACCMDPSRMSSSNTSMNNGRHGTNHHEKRDMPEDDRTTFLEIDDEETTATMTSPNKTMMIRTAPEAARIRAISPTSTNHHNATANLGNRHQYATNDIRKQSSKCSYDSIPMLPSGLSVEPDPELESQYHHRQ